MDRWNALLEALDGPRENGTAALSRAAGALVDALTAAGVHPEAIDFRAEPHRLHVLGFAALIATATYWGLLRRGHRALAFAVAVSLSVATLAELDGFVGVFGWIGAGEQQHVHAEVPAVDPEQRLIFTAHYDSKTDLLDHHQRAPIEALGLPITLLLWIGPAFRRVGRVAGPIGALYGASLCAALSGGLAVRTRSHGMVDDAAGCVALAAVAERLAAAPLAHTTVEFLWLSAEEVGTQGSWVYAGERFAGPPDLPTAVVNVDPIGATADLQVLAREGFTLRSYAPDEGLVALLDRVYREERGRPLPQSAGGGVSDARSFLARGIPAVTLMADPGGGAVPPGLHTARDQRASVDAAALASAVDLLAAVASAADRDGWAGR